MNLVEVKEGQTTFFIPQQDIYQTFPPGTAPVFFNPRMKFNRDATILLLSTIKPTNYLDAMGATGVRGLRVAAECGIPSIINDRNSRAFSLIKQNAERYGSLVRVTNCDVNTLMSSQRFDAVDLDPFGSPAYFVDAAARSALRFLFVTATDTAPLCGAHLRAGRRRYFAEPMNTEYHSEVGLRTLLGFLVREVIKYDRGLEPLFCFSREHYVRLHVRLKNSAQAADQTLDKIGYILQCPVCPYRTEVRGLLPDHALCGECGERLRPVGPLWTGAINNRVILEEMLEIMENSASRMDKPLASLISLLHGELDTSSFYDYHHLAKRWRISPPPIDSVVERLQDLGFHSSRTHFCGTGLKTDAPLVTIREALTPL